MVSGTSSSSSCLSYLIQQRLLDVVVFNVITTTNNKHDRILVCVLSNGSSMPCRHLVFHTSCNVIHTDLGSNVNRFSVSLVFLPSMTASMILVAGSGLFEGRILIIYALTDSLPLQATIVPFSSIQEPSRMSSSLIAYQLCLQMLMMPCLLLKTLVLCIMSMMTNIHVLFEIT